MGLKRRTEHMDRLDRLGVSVNTGAEVERQDPQTPTHSAPARSGPGIAPQTAVSTTTEGQKQTGLAPVRLGEPKRLRKRT